MRSAGAALGRARMEQIAQHVDSPRIQLEAESTPTCWPDGAVPHAIRSEGRSTLLAPKAKKPRAGSCNQPPRRETGPVGGGVRCLAACGWSARRPRPGSGLWWNIRLRSLRSPPKSRLAERRLVAPLDPWFLRLRREERDRPSLRRTGGTAPSGRHVGVDSASSGTSVNQSATFSKSNCLTADFSFVGSPDGLPAIWPRSRRGEAQIGHGYKLVTVE